MSLSPAQIAVRRTGIGSSDIGAVAGLSPYASPLDVWLVKRGLAEVPETDAMRLGTALEPVIADLYAVEHLAPGEVLRYPRDVSWPWVVAKDTVRHPHEPWILATPDRAVTVPEPRDAGEPWHEPPTRLVEIKSVSWRAAHHWGEAHDDVPAWYRAQIEWQMLATGVSRCDLVALIGGAELRVYQIEHDPELAAMLVEIGRAFWRHVEAGTEPPVDASESWRRHLESRFPRAEGGTLEAGHEAEEIAARLADATARAKAAERDRDQAANELRAQIGASRGITGRGWRATWSDVAGAPRWKDIAMQLGADARPELVAEHTAAPSRRFTFTTKGQ